LDTPGASSFVLAARPLVQEAIPRARQLALRIAWRAMRRLGLLAPVCVVARKAMSGETVERPSDAPHRRAPLILLTGGHRSVNKVVGVVMRDHGAEPSAVVKMPRVPESIPALWNEARTLQQLEGRPNPVQGAPRVLSFVEQGASTRLVESAIRGVPVAARLRAGTYRRFALQAADWQVRLAGRAAPVGPAAWWDRLVEPALAEVSAAYGPVLDVCQLERTREQLSGLSTLPLVCEQRDFSPWNVLVDGNGELAVLDWESSELRGLPALDLIYFLAYLAFYVDGAMASGRFRQAHRRALDPSTPTGRVTHDALRRYCEGVGLDPTALGPLRLLTWLVHARSEYRQLTADAGHRPSPEQLRSAVFITLWQEELRNVEAGARSARAFGWDHGKAASP
jgi:hypothetical protein